MLNFCLPPCSTCSTALVGNGGSTTGSLTGLSSFLGAEVFSSSLAAATATGINCFFTISSMLVGGWVWWLVFVLLFCDEQQSSLIQAPFMAYYIHISLQFRINKKVLKLAALN